MVHMDEDVVDVVRSTFPASRVLELLGSIGPGDCSRDQNAWPPFADETGRASPEGGSARCSASGGPGRASRHRARAGGLSYSP
jgi:hypothetical protein